MQSSHVPHTAWLINKQINHMAINQINKQINHMAINQINKQINHMANLF